MSDSIELDYASDDPDEEPEAGVRRDTEQGHSSDGEDREMRRGGR